MENKENKGGSCPYFLPWVNTSRGEILCACVDNVAKTIRKCEWTRSGGCWKYPAEKKGGVC